MHHTNFCTDKKLAKQFEILYCNHNSDWSGDVQIVWKRKKHGDWDSEHEKHEVEMPGELLIALGRAASKQHLINEVVSFLEQL